MGAHRIQHRDQSNNLPVTADPSTQLVSQINAPASLVAPTSIVSAGPTSAPHVYTILTTTETLILVSGVQSTVVITSSVTDAAAYAALTAVATATATTSQIRSSTSHASTETSASNASQKAASHTGTLLAAIVVPVAVVLVVSFALFWFLMRRRHHRELKDADFLMTGKVEKLASTSSSTKSPPSSAHGDRKSGSKLGLVVTSTHLPRSNSDRDRRNSLLSYASNHGGITGARAVMSDGEPPARPPRAELGQENRPQSPYITGYARRRDYDFNSPRPGTARNAPPNPSVQNAAGGRHRSYSSPARGPPPQGYRGPPPPPGPGGNGAPRGLANSAAPRLGPLPVVKNFSTPNGAGPTSRAAPPAPIAVIPLGSFNGTGPISQYSPIVKEMPKKPYQLRASNLSDGGDSSAGDLRSPSTPGSPGAGLTEENMMIARLGAMGDIGRAMSPVAPQQWQQQPRPMAPAADIRRNATQRSAVSAVSENDGLHAPANEKKGEWEDEEVASEVSSLHEDEMGKFNFDSWGRQESQRTTREPVGWGGDESRNGRVSPISGIFAR